MQNAIPWKGSTDVYNLEPVQRGRHKKVMKGILLELVQCLNYEIFTESGRFHTYKKTFEPIYKRGILMPFSNSYGTLLV